MELYLYRIEPVRPEMPTSPTAGETALVEQHFAHLARAHASGLARYVGRTAEAPFLGIAILAASSREEAERLLREDPAVAGGVFRGAIQAFREVFPWRAG